MFDNKKDPGSSAVPPLPKHVFGGIALMAIAILWSELNFFESEKLPTPMDSILMITGLFWVGGFFFNRTSNAVDFWLPKIGASALTPKSFFQSIFRIFILIILAFSGIAFLLHVLDHKLPVLSLVTWITIVMVHQTVAPYFIETTASRPVLSAERSLKVGNVPPQIDIGSAALVHPTLDVPNISPVNIKISNEPRKQWHTKKIAALVVLFAIALFSILVWPTVHVYEYRYVDGEFNLTRTNRFTSITEKWVEKTGWTYTKHPLITHDTPREVVNPVFTQSELVSITGTATLEHDILGEKISLTLYNGGARTIRKIKISLAIEPDLSDYRIYEISALGTPMRVFRCDCYVLNPKRLNKIHLWAILSAEE